MPVRASLPRLLCVQRGGSFGRLGYQRLPRALGTADHQCSRRRDHRGHVEAEVKAKKRVCRTLSDGTRRCSVKRRRGVSGTATSVPAPSYANPDVKCSCARGGS